jgi:flagellar hook assembly protein FlgD
MDGTRPGGNHTVEWNGSDASGRTAASGVYFYRLVAGRFEQTKKMILLR